MVNLAAETSGLLARAREEGQIIADLACDEAFEGHWRRPDADARAFRQGWYFTGDTGYADETGYLFATGRIDDLIITSGENVSPGEIESVVSPHQAVAEIAVAGSPDQRPGRRVTLLSSALQRSTRTPSTPGAVLRGSPIKSRRAPGSLSPISRNRRLARSCAASSSLVSTKKGVNSARRAAIDH